MVVTREGFSQVVFNAFAGLGFPADGPVVYEFPMGMFLMGSDLTPLNENIDKIVYGLTKWQPKITAKGVYHPDMVTVQGTDYQNAVDNMNALFLKNMWGDGLPLVAPTVDRIKWILTGTDIAPDTVLSPAGGVLPRGGIATVETVAVALAMAGGRPEYLPVLIAAVQAMTEPTMKMQSWQATTNSVIPVVIVNGPMAKQIRLGSGYGLLGPDSQHPAGGPIGRALRIIQQDLGGATPGIGTMAIYGGMRYTDAVFAEDEEGLPKNWTSLAEDRGFKRDQSVVTVTLVNSMENISWSGGFGTKEANDRILRLIASVMGAPSVSRMGNQSVPMWKADNANFVSGLVMLGRGGAAGFASVSGYTKQDVKAFLWNNSKTPWSVLEATGLTSYAEGIGFKAGQDVPITMAPEQIMIVVAGGDQSGHSYLMRPSMQGDMASKEMQLPTNWDALLKQAAADLGPLPVAH